MKTNINNHFLFHCITIVQGFLAESPHINVQIYVRILASDAKFNEGEPSFSIENLELNKETRCVQLLTMLGFKLTYQVYALSVRKFENSLRQRSASWECRSLDSSRRTICSL